MRLKFIAGLMALSMLGCVSIPKPSVQSNVPAGLDRNDVELAILLATGLAADDSNRAKTWPEYISTTLKNAGNRHVSRLDESSDHDRWAFDSADGKRITASYVDGTEILRAAIDFTSSSYSIQITGSQELDETATKIDREAGLWIDELKLRIDRALGRVQLMKRTYTQS